VLSSFEINFELISASFLASASQVLASVELFHTCCHLSLLPYHRSLCRKAGKGQCCFSGLDAVLVGLAGIFESLKMCGKGFLGREGQGVGGRRGLVFAVRGTRSDLGPGLF
jgi:hypothetical protein